MLSDDERRALLDLERRLTDEDPDLARSFQKQFERSRAQHGLEAVERWAVKAAVVLSVVLLLVGLPGAALTCALTTGIVWLMHRFPDESGEGANHHRRE